MVTPGIEVGSAIIDDPIMSCPLAPSDKRVPLNIIGLAPVLSVCPAIAKPVGAGVSVWPAIIIDYRLVMLKE